VNKQELLMSPTLKRVGKYRIFIYSEENKASFELPHVHVSVGSIGAPGYQEAEIWLGPPISEKANEGFRQSEMNTIKKMVANLRVELRRGWDVHFS
jgi:hypothetical protein